MFRQRFWSITKAAILLALVVLCRNMTAIAIGQSPAPVPADQSAGNVERWINTDWKFLRVDGAEPTDPSAPAFDDHAWKSVTLPHTPRIEAYNQSRPWQGICWYRKTILPDPSWTGKRVTVQFGAAMQVADVWVNGIHRMQHLGGYLPFTVDITDQIATGQPVILAVKLDNRDTDQVPPGKPTQDLDFNYPGGLYRGVLLRVTDPIHVSDPVTANIVAGGGIFVTYSDVSEASATVHVQTDVANDGDSLARRVTVHSTLLDAAGNPVTDAVSPGVLLSAQDHHAVIQTLTVDHPHLWSPDHPNLYTLRTVVSRGGARVDQVSTRIGIRSVTLDSRLRINGQEVRIIGSNRHQEYPYLEYALSPNASRRDAQRIKDGGLNFIRLSHYPQDPAFLDACDTLGIMVQAPIPGWQIFDDNPSFISTTYQNIRDLIRKDRNHPCVIFWEPNLNETAPPADWSRTAWDIAHQEYPGPECYTFGDAYGPKWSPGWDVKYLWREYGDFGFGGNDSTSRRTRGQGEAAMLQQAWNFQWEDNHLRADFDQPGVKFYGDATWCMFDYNRGAVSTQEVSGMMDIFRLPKYVYHFFQSQRDPKLAPTVFLATDWAKRAPTTRVIVYSNCDEVALSVNGKLIRRQKPDSGPDTPYSPQTADLQATVGGNYDSSGGNPYDGGNAKHLDHAPFTFKDVPYKEGVVKAVGYLSGKPVAEDTVHTPEKPTALALTMDTQGIPLTADGTDAIFVRANIQDKNGTIVPINAWSSLRFTVTGPARLIGTSPVHVEAGVASVLLQATDTPGVIHLSVTGDGLRSASAVLTSQPEPQPVSRVPETIHKGPEQTHFTPLTGTAIGTPGAYANGTSDIMKAFDGDTSSFVDAAESTNGDDCWVGLDLGMPKRITRIRFYPRLGHTDRMPGGIFQGSDTADFQHPTNLATIEDEPDDGQWTAITDIDLNRAFRYVRYLSPPDGWNNIAELGFDTSP